MMGRALEKLISASSTALGNGKPVIEARLRALVGSRASELQSLLEARNGFYAFESALHVFAAEDQPVGAGLSAWNSTSLWISAYGGLADGFLFFAEDVFGCQFALKDNRVWTFDPETGEAQILAKSLEDWACRIEDDYATLTGYPLAHAWQVAFGALEIGKRLVPKIPFVMGGEFAINNLHALDAIESMRFRACIALQIRDLPDGTQVKLQITD